VYVQVEGEQVVGVELQRFENQLLSYFSCPLELQADWVIIVPRHQVHEGLGRQSIRICHLEGNATIGAVVKRGQVAATVGYLNQQET
jgi:hypothetical protein